MTQKNAYSKMTHRYDDVLTARKWWSKLYMNVLWRVDDNIIATEVINMISDNFSGKLLDIPVGTAIFTSQKYKKMENAQIVGVDYSPQMLEVAQQRIDVENVTNVTLEVGDAGNLHFPDNSFDIVLSMNGFHCFPDKEKAFAETHRVLKPGGMFCGCFYIKGERKPADWFVRNIANKKGIFLPPHLTLEQAKAQLNKLYGDNIEIQNYRSLFVFKCIKNKIYN